MHGRLVGGGDCLLHNPTSGRRSWLAPSKEYAARAQLSTNAWGGEDPPIGWIVMTSSTCARDAALLFHEARGSVRRARICAANGKWVPLNPQTSYDLTLTGAGILRKLWCVFNADGKPLAAMNTLKEHRDLYRNIWLHIAFDDCDEVQVSAPLADFFLFGHGDLEDVDTPYFQSVRIPPFDECPYQGALTCFAPMPFAQCAKISFVNQNSIPVRLIANFDWLELDEIERPFYYFHATYRHRRCHNEPMVLLDRRNVEGRFIGLGLYVNNRDHLNRWHEAPECLQINDRPDLVMGTGGEDYFCLAWGFRRLVSRPQFGVTCLRPDTGSPTLKSGRFNPAGEYAMYRFHLHDSVNFSRSLRLFFAKGGVGRAQKVACLEFRSVAFWYGRPLAG
jgi:Protein of unknown function (DUF2961)